MDTDQVSVSELPESPATRQLREAQEVQKQAQQVQPVQVQQPVQPAPQIVERAVLPDDIRQLVKDAKEEARQEEKQKLYDKISKAEGIEQENAALKQNVQTLTQENTELKGKVSTQEGTGDATNAPSYDPDILIDKAVSAAESKFAAERQQWQSQITELKTQLVQRDLTTIRDAIIADAKGEIVEELVQGNTEEELKISAVEAKKAYQRIMGRVGNPNPQPPAGNTAPQQPLQPPPQPQPVSPAAPPVVSPGPTNVNFEPSVGDESDKFAADVKNMSVAEYGKHRMALRRRVQELHPPEPNPLTNR